MRNVAYDTYRAKRSLLIGNDPMYAIRNLWLHVRHQLFKLVAGASERIIWDAIMAPQVPPHNVTAATVKTLLCCTCLPLELQECSRYISVIVMPCRR